MSVKRYLVDAALGESIGMIATDLIAFLPEAIFHCHAEGCNSVASQARLASQAERGLIDAATDA